MFSQVTSESGRAALARALTTLAQHFQAAGATPLNLPFLYPCEELLELYGEDLRARAFVFGDAERGDEMCLRPDFTVPVALAYREGGWGRKAAYCYQGTVFRRQPGKADRPVEYLQAGIERFGEMNTAKADASVFLSLHSALRELGVHKIVATIGDLSIVLAVLDALEMPEFRRAALKRHIWRQKRFQSLIARACKGQELNNLVRKVSTAVPEVLVSEVERAGEHVGQRDLSDVRDRIALLLEQAKAPAMREADARLISNILEVNGPARDACSQLLKLTKDAGVDIEPALTLFEQRLKLLSDGSGEGTEFYFDAAFGRSLEYYDGFVFELRLAGVALHPPLAGGGRYNAMTQRLGATTAVPAVGGILRPEAVLEAIE